MVPVREYENEGAEGAFYGVFKGKLKRKIKNSILKF
jgi:hypothetical protein